MNRLIICGPTATGKTKLALQLAKKFDGEIVSADSRQVYKGMDVGTGKDTKCTMYPLKRASNVKCTIEDFQIGYYEIEGIKVWMLDVVKPDYKFNVSDYKQCADAVMDDVYKRGKLPIIVGGTGFYIKAITENIETIGIEPNWELREQLSHCSIVSLLNCLRKVDSDRLSRMNESDRQNPRRLIRAIEVAQNSEIRNPKSETNSKFEILNSKFNNLVIGLTALNEILYKRIDERVEQRLKNGIEDEIKELLNKGYSWKNSALGNTLAYSEWKEYFDKVSQVSKVSRVPRAEDKDEIKKKVIQKWKFDEHNYCRRQMTWFKKQKNINWFDISEKNYETKVEKSVENWYIVSNVK